MAVVWDWPRRRVDSTDDGGCENLWNVGQAQNPRRQPYLTILADLKPKISPGFNMLTKYKASLPNLKITNYIYTKKPIIVFEEIFRRMRQELSNI
jgi:hypothetical protein